MKRILYLLIFCALSTLAQAQHTFQGTSLSEALIELDKSSKHYDISFVYDELEDFTVTKTVKRGRSLPDAVREVCGFYPVRVNVKGRDILVECIQKDRTKLMGRLIGPDRQPIAYANIILYNPTDSVIMDGGVSNEAGDFVIPCSAEQARVRISCIGFRTIERQMPISNVGTIRMQVENNYLGNVTVSGRIPVFRSEADRLQYIVSNDEFARGLNAQELLNRVPMVSMAGGRAMILGRGPAHFMLNGRITEIGNEAIQQKLWTMRSEDIERIEVISNPLGREMMEIGSGGYINIVMRHDQTLGWRGDISAEAGVSDDWSERGSGSVSYASKKFDMTIDAHGGCTTQMTNNVTVYHVYPIDYISDTRSKQTDKEVAANFTFRYMPIKQLELGGMLSWQTLWPETATNGELSYYDGLSSWSKADLLPYNNTINKSLTAYCDWRFDPKGKLLSLTYNNYKKKEDAQTKILYENPVDILLNRNIGHADYHIQSVRIDLSLPFNFLSIDAGTSYTNIKNQAGLILQNDHVIQLDYLVRLNDQYGYKEKTKAAYLSLHREWDNFSFKAGFCYEHIDLDIEENGHNIELIQHGGSSNPILYYKTFCRDYWLPSFHFSFKPKAGHQIGLSWGTSTIRPNFYDLNPLRIYKTGFETFKGDPRLQPSRTSHIELTYHNHQGLSASAYHHHASDVVDWITTVGRWNRDIIVGSSPTNIDRVNKTGLYLHYQRQLNPSLLVTAEGEVYYYDYHMTFQNFQMPVYSDGDIYYSPLLIMDYIQNLNGWGERLAFSADWYLNPRHTLLLNARYQHWFSDHQGANKTDGYGYFYFALRYSMLNDRLKLSLVANDPFHQYVTDETLYTIYSHINHHAHYIGFTATYAFGGKKVRRVHHDTKDTERQRAEKQK